MGRCIENEKIEKEKISEEILMEVKNITSEGKFKDISFNLRKGGSYSSYRTAWRWKRSACRGVIWGM